MKLDGLFPFALQNYDFKTLLIESQCLASNPLGDLSQRANTVLCPKELTADTPVIFYLSGYSSDGWKNFSFGRFENNLVQDIDQWTTEGHFKPAVFVFVNAWTRWGGSQFINSMATGEYENYIVQELVPEVKKQFPKVENPERWIVFGGSSGGYGALHLASKYPQVFSHAVALAPDSLFEVSLLPEIYKYLPYLKEVGGLEVFYEKYKQGQIKWSHDIQFGVLNLAAMTCCYAPQIIDQKKPAAVESLDDFLFPISDNGKLDSKIWNEWLKHDPIQFLNERKKQVKQLKSVLVFTGNKDEYGLQYGSRQIYNLLTSFDVNVNYTELPGTHRNIDKFRLPALMDVFNQVRIN